MNKSLTRKFNFFRYLAIVALVCTICMVIVLCGEALKPGDKSGATSGEVEDTIKDFIPDIPDNQQTYELVSIRCKQLGSSGAVGEKLTLTFAYTPSQATNKQLTFSSSDPSIVSVDESGVVTFNSYGTATITAKSQSNPSVKTSVKLFCSGVPADDISNIYPTFDNKAGGAPKHEIAEGTYADIGFVNDQGQIVSISTLNVVCNDPDILRMDNTKHFVAIKPGVTTITITNPKTNQSKDVAITVIESDTFAAPESFEFSQDVLYVDKNTTFDPRENISKILPEGATFDTRFCSVKCLDASLFDVSSDIYTATTLGETYFQITSYATGSVSTFKVVVVEPLPKQLIVMGNDRIVRGEQYTYTVFDGQRDCDKVTWSIIKGGATITDDGKLVANKLGNVVIRATSTQDESIYVDFTVRVSLYENFHTFVRKIFGHFSAFALLGIEFAATFFLLSGRARFFSPLFALFSGAAVAAITEVLQMPIFTPNRGPSVKDALIDTAGVAAGVVVTAIIVALYFVIVRLISKKNCQQTWFVISKLSFKTMLMPAKKIFDDTKNDQTTATQTNTKD